MFEHNIYLSCVPNALEHLWLNRLLFFGIWTTIGRFICYQFDRNVHRSIESEQILILTQSH